jgi:hypothetical protein
LSRRTTILFSVDCVAVCCSLQLPRLPHQQWFAAGNRRAGISRWAALSAAHSVEHFRLPSAKPGHASGRKYNAVTCCNSTTKAAGVPKPDDQRQHAGFPTCGYLHISGRVLHSNPHYVNTQYTVTDAVASWRSIWQQDIVVAHLLQAFLCVLPGRLAAATFPHYSVPHQQLPTSPVSRCLGSHPTPHQLLPASSRHHRSRRAGQAGWHCGPV